MQDIVSKGNNSRRSSRSSAPDDLPPEVKALYEKQASKAPAPKPRFTGSKVPVSNVHVPKQVLPTKRPAPAVKSRPLFVPKEEIKKSPVTSKKGTTATMRIGYKERKIVAVLLILVLLAAGLAAAIFLPKADISLVLATAPLLIDQELTIRGSEASAASNIIPGSSFVREVKVDGTSPVTSTEVIGTKARGTVTLVNRTTQEQPIREQSRLVTQDGILFYMQRHAIIPPDSSVSVEVEAAEAGEAGNVSSGRLDFAALDASSQSLVYAEVNQPLTGGSGQEVSVVKAEDIEQAQEAAKTAARQKVEQEIRAELQENWTLLDESWTSEIQSFESDAKENDQKSTITYSALVMVRVLGYEEKALQDRLKQSLEERLDQDYMLFPGPISFTKSVNGVNWETGEGTITVRVTHTTIPTFSLETLRDKIAGRSQEDALSYLQGLKGVQSASVELSPFWVQTIPRIDKRISIELVSDRQP